MLEDHGKYLLIKVCVDDKHAGDMSNRRSYSSIIIYVNNTPIIWYSKRHNKYLGPTISPLPS